MLLQITDPFDDAPNALHDTKQGETLAVGIDLGTTNSVVAYVKDNQPITLSLKGKRLTPSVVSLKDNQLSLLEGTEDAPTDVIFRSTKRLFSNPTQKLFQTKETPLTIATSLLRYVKNEAEKTLNTEIIQAVITVPAYFDELARQATKRAAEQAGFTVLRLIAEPTAAALAYGLERGVEGIYAVFDMGGGTFDFSLLKLQREVFQVLATGGDTFLGGDDIDEAICQHCNVYDLPSARALKESLGTLGSAEVLGQRLTKDELNTLSQPFIQRALDVCTNVLRDADLNPRQIEGVVLVGGSTRLQCLQQAVEKFFGKPPLTNINPDEVVAHGAALQAHALTQGSSTLLLDVTPLSLGIETMGGLVEKIIPRNTPLPCRVAQDFTTSIDGQTHLAIHILQGEREFVKDCRSLGRFVLKGIPPMPCHTPRIRVSFQLDADGLLSVSAIEQTTGQCQTLDIKPSSISLDHHTLETMISDAAKHSAEDIRARLLAQGNKDDLPSP